MPGPSLLSGPIILDGVIESMARTGVVITVEAHSIHGGLGSLVAEIIAEKGVSARLRRLGIPEGQFAPASPRSAIEKEFLLDETGIAWDCEGDDLTWLSVTVRQYSPSTRERAAPKAILFSLDGKILTSRTESYSIEYPRPGLVEIDPEALLKSVYLACKGAISDYEAKGGHRDEILTIGISNQRESFLLWDHKGEPVSPVVVWAMQTFLGFLPRVG